MRNFAKFLPVFAIAFFGAIFLGGVNFAAAEIPVSPSIDNVPAGPSCFDYYHFQSVQVSVDTDQDQYATGDKVVFSGKLINQNDYPVVDGYVFVRISKDNPNYATEGRYVVDEFFGAEKVILDAKATKDIQFDWRVPAVSAGKYHADYFFSVGKKFNLGGLPFTNEVTIGNADFEFKSDDGWFYFDRATTKVNGEKYLHIGGWASFDSGSAVVITQPIINTFKQSQKISVKYELYRWDSLLAEDKLAEKSEEIALPANAAATLRYTIPAISEPVYYLKITASGGDQKSIVNIRVVSNLERPRLNYPGITKFPLVKGDAFTFFSCFHNTSGADTSGKVLVTLSDKSGQEVGKMEYAGRITSAMMADKTDLTAAKNYDYLKLNATLIDKDGKTIDSYETVYDCNAIDPNKCQKTYWPYYALAILLLLLIGAAVWWGRRRRSDLPVMAAGLLVLVGAWYFQSPEPVSSAGASPQSQTQTSTVNSSNNTLMLGDSRDRRSVLNWAASMVHSVSIDATTYSKNYVLRKNDPISFTYSNSGTYNGQAGAWDTPYLGQYLNITGANILVNTSTNPTASISSSQPGVVSCSGMNCTAVGSGTATLTANITGVRTMVADATINWNAVRDGVTICSNWYLNTSNRDGYGSPLGNPEAGRGSCEPGGNRINRGAWGDDMYLTGNYLDLPATSVSWTVTVGGPPTVTLTALPTTVDYYGASTLTWTVADATTCTASGGWSGNKATTGGSESTGSLTAATTYTITCSNAEGSTIASATVNVNPPQHTACSNGACVVKDGLASNECASVLDCGGGGGGQNHFDCVSNACVSVNGAGYDKCASNTDCGGAEHSKCVNRACVIVPGAGTNACRNDANCGGGAGQTYGVCSNNACTQVAGSPPPDVFTCGVDADCGNVPSYTLRSSNNLSIVIIQDDVVYCSNKTTIKAISYRGYNSDIKLSVADFGGLAVATSSNFSINPLTINDYATGAQFSVCAKPGASAGPYNLKVAGTPGGQTVLIKLNVVRKAPTFKETSLWRLLAGVRGWF